jgi:nicotinate-nucleotide adenylyltransferase
MASPHQLPVTPLSLPPDVREVLLFGGTFDPPHTAHARLPLLVRTAMLGPGSWLVFVPAARNPLKKQGPEATDESRLAMLRLLIDEEVAAATPSNVAIWTDELDRARINPGPTFTIDTVDRLKATVGEGVDIRLLIGSDQAADFHRWRSARELFAQTRPLVMLREPLGTVDALRSSLAATNAWSKTDIDAWLSRVAAADTIDISSSALRTLLHAPARNMAILRRLLSPAVLAYIESHGLYR